jgi:hypothetical protein
MKNNNKTLSASTKMTARVALRSAISQAWHNRRNSQQIRNVRNVHFWNTEIKLNVSALREIRDL